MNDLLFALFLFSCIVLGVRAGQAVSRWRWEARFRREASELKEWQRANPPKEQFTSSAWDRPR